VIIESNVTSQVVGKHRRCQSRRRKSREIFPINRIEKWERWFQTICFDMENMFILRKIYKNYEMKKKDNLRRTHSLLNCRQVI